MKPNKYASTLKLMVICTVLVLGSCAEDDSPDDIGSGYTLRDHVHEIQETEIESYNPSTGTITFNDIPSYEVGEIVISGISDQTPYGLLRRIDSLTENTVYTSQATLSEAVEECYLDTSFTLMPLLEERGYRVDDLTFNIPIENMIFYDQDGNYSTVDDQISLNGNISLSAEVTDFILESSWLHGLEYFELNTLLGENVDLEFSASTSVLDFQQEQDIVPDIHCVPIQVGPLTLAPRVGFFAGIEGDISTVNVEVSQFASIGTGIVFNGSDWSTSSNPSNDFDFESPNLSSNLSVKTYAGMRLELYPYDLVAAAYVGGDGFLRAEVETDEDPWWTLYGGLEARVGAMIEVYGWPIAGWSTPLFVLEEVLAQAEESQNQDPILVDIPNLESICGQQFTYQVYASDPDGDSLAYSDNTELFDINPQSGLIQFIPNYNDIGTHPIAISVSDVNNGSDSDGFLLEIAEESNYTPFELINAISGPSNNLTGIVVAEDNLIVCDPTTDKIYRLNHNGVLLNEYDTPCEDIAGITFDGTYFWVANRYNGGLYSFVSKLNSDMDVTEDYQFPSSIMGNGIISDVGFGNPFNGDIIGRLYLCYESAGILELEIDQSHNITNQSYHTSYDVLNQVFNWDLNGALKGIDSPNSASVTLWFFINDNRVFDGRHYPNSQIRYSGFPNVDGIDLNGQTLFSCLENVIYRHNAPEDWHE